MYVSTCLYSCFVMPGCAWDSAKHIPFLPAAFMLGFCQSGPWREPAGLMEGDLTDSFTSVPVGFASGFFSCSSYWSLHIFSYMQNRLHGTPQIHQLASTSSWDMSPRPAIPLFWAVSCNCSSVIPQSSLSALSVT